jgi:hypothetical protein
MSKVPLYAGTGSCTLRQSRAWLHCCHHARRFGGVFKSQFSKVFQEIRAHIGQKLTNGSKNEAIRGWDNPRKGLLWKEEPVQTGRAPVLPQTEAPAHRQTEPGLVAFINIKSVDNGFVCGFISGVVSILSLSRSLARYLSRSLIPSLALSLSLSLSHSLSLSRSLSYSLACSLSLLRACVAVHGGSNACAALICKHF